MYEKEDEIVLRNLVEEKNNSCTEILKFYGSYRWKIKEKKVFWPSFFQSSSIWSSSFTSYSSGRGSTDTLMN